MKNKEVLEKILLAMYAQEKIEKINEYDRKCTRKNGIK